MNLRKDLAVELRTLQDRLAGARGRKYWRTLEELSDDKAFQELMQREFPEQASEWPDLLSRRRFLSLMGASLALAGLNGCSVRPAPSRSIVPYVKAPEEIVPGKPLFFATAMTMGGTGVGLLVESHMGRPTKVEGNPDHPASLGATDPYHQASVLTLYDPDRSQTVTHLGQTRSWDEALAALQSAIARTRPRGGAGLRVLTETVVSPTLGQQLAEFLKAFPQAKWHQYEPIAREPARQASVLAFGEVVDTYCDFSRADVVLSLDADFLSCGPGNLRYVADFMARRRVRTTTADANSAVMNRLYVVETALSTTGAKADHRLAVPASEVETIARAIAAKVGAIAGQNVSASHDKWTTAVAIDLEKHRGRCVVLAGERQPPAVHVLAHALNAQLGNTGKTVLHTRAVAVQPVDPMESLRELTEDMAQGEVEVLLILGGNPAYSAPADLSFVEKMQKVPLRAHLSLYQDETSRQCHWHLPKAHYLEAWSDTRAFEGTASIAQPLIEPLYHGRSAHELLSALVDKVQTPGYEIVRAYWRKHWPGQSAGNDFETRWETALHDGVVAGTKFPTRSLSLKDGWADRLPPADATENATAFEILFVPDPAIYDGRFANNGWLQEMPKPITKLTWDNAALMSPATAKRLGVWYGSYAHGGEHGGFEMPVVELDHDGRKLKAVAWIVPGQADGTIVLSLGYGRTNAGRVGGTPDNPVGFNAYLLRTSTQPWFASGLQVRKTGESYMLACTQQHQLMENRELVRSADLAAYQKKPNFAPDGEAKEYRDITAQGRKPLTLYQPYAYTEHKWGMAIDLTACTGCHACVVACQAENNIPVVGKDQVLAGREMHWLRVDRYNAGPFDHPSEFHFQPVPCMHCEHAPCEYVCPTEATVHSADGLNDMVYQRCIGTRFCSNNCPYKVRRFNFFFYADFATPSLRQQYNPDVTVRSRGVMEKCTYCVQRIRHAEINSQREERSIFDGEILTACQAACPAGAIVFGDINDAKSKVRQWKDSPLNYSLLDDVNTLPRTTYLAALRNPNPALETE